MCACSLLGGASIVFYNFWKLHIMASFWCNWKKINKKNSIYYKVLYRLKWCGYSWLVVKGRETAVYIFYIFLATHILACIWRNSMKLSAWNIYHKKLNCYNFCICIWRGDAAIQLFSLVTFHCFLNGALPNLICGILILKTLF